ncbi:hypothetical protein A584_03610 [Pseudomonas syringae pv. theae ICMP 3923]|uniref:Uncharacterized protein n=3 Tax=Pseudomonas syringae group TaxID=136849 RepID=A0A261WHT9_9PSED|nr:DUF6031 family protein [Pseudomonas syringae]OZI85657.1 hypothetical protein CFN58_16520 [Pseudomonas avellanae]ATV18232.1 hypothetical protein CT122_16340 [Pseudomonas syringae pv. actinidiae]EPM58507.1 hypothetical protein A262_12842 [Pseudomonas syringae pv. actinidiae ICMP 19073]EPM59236.1 hypothetical protein A264_14621 [Pseudomonas syringae pv. actinidiae ICMP 19071]EPM72791.1 hypothetical protein A584_03610 [Pseudomonas syringae pv. theae ICMP 3923]
MITDSEQVSVRKWFPRLAGGYVYPAGPHAQKLISVAWLLMTELEAYLEDLEGAASEPRVIDALRIKLAELMVDIDCRLAGADTPDELHQFALFTEYGLSDVIAHSGQVAVEWLGVPCDTTADRSDEASRLIELFKEVLAAFPGKLFNPLLPGTQGQVLRTLRDWDRSCRLAGRDAAFLAPLMRSL